MKVLDTNTLTHLFGGHQRVIETLARESEDIATTVALGVALVVLFFLRVKNHPRGFTMNRIIIKSKISGDGTLHLSVPVGLEEANKEVQVTVEPCTSNKPMTQEEWRAWVDSMAGTWQGDFERPPQGEYEERDPLS
jgi:hypothetical protein